MLKLPHANKVLISDSAEGVVFGLDLHTGMSEVAINDPLMKPVPGPIILGINGIRLGKDNELFFTNTLNLTFNRVHIRTDGSAAGSAEIIAKSGIGDDFALDNTGDAFVAQNFENTFEKISPKGAFSVLAGNLNSTQLVGPTSARFGRTSKDKKTLYITTTGGLSGPVNGTFTEGGMVVALDL
jgi:sugar lactone lactonase YvrE